jgi:hypothetical protein
MPSTFRENGSALRTLDDFIEHNVYSLALIDLSLYRLLIQRVRMQVNDDGQSYV